MTVKDYLLLKEKLETPTRVYKNGKLFAIVNGKEIPENEFVRSLGIPDRLYSAKENPCKKVGALV